MSAEQVKGARPETDRWVAAVYEAEKGGRPIGSGFLVDGWRVVTCAHVVCVDGVPRGDLWIEFPNAIKLMPRRVSVRPEDIVVPDPEQQDEADVAVLRLTEQVPGDLAARLRRPAPHDLVGRRWWSFGYPEDMPFGNSADGTVGEAVGYGWIRLDTESRYGVKTGYSGAALWSEEYQAVVGVVGHAHRGTGDALALTLLHADRSLPGEKLHLLTGWALSGDAKAGRHWHPRARGVVNDADPSFRFRGRTAALNAIVSVISGPGSPREALVVTGSPGAGKSAVLGRIVTSADPDFARLLPADDDAVRAPSHSIACAVHARGKMALDVAAEIARAASAAIPQQVMDFAPALRDALQERQGGLFAVVIDALDEAASPGEARDIVNRIIVPMAENCADLGVRVVVGTRRADDEGDLLGERGVFGRAAAVVDLDESGYFAEADLAAYTLASLQLLGAPRDDNPYQDPAIAGPVAARIAARADGNFLIAGLIARAHGQHDKTPIRPGQISFTPTVDGALREYLQKVRGAAGYSAQQLLTALAFAEDPGFTPSLWQIALKALYGRAPDSDVLRTFARSSAANFLLVSSADDGRARNRSYQLFHQALNDVLLAARDDVADVAEDEQALARALIASGSTAGWASSPDYLLRSLPGHAVRGGIIDELLADDEYLLQADLRRLTSQSARATTDAGKQRARLLQLTPYAATADPRERRALFSVTETLEKLGSSFSSGPGPVPYRARWSTVSTRKERVTQEGHTGAVTVVCSLDLGGCPVLASGGEDEVVRIWDPVTGRQRLALEGHAGQVNNLHAFPGEGGRTLLASSGADALVRIWDPETGQQQQILEGHKGTVSAVCSFTAEGTRTLLASGGADGTVRTWDPLTGRQQLVLEGHDEMVYAVCSFTSGGRALLASAGKDGKILIWDPASGEVRRPLERRTGEEDEGSSGVVAVCAFSLADGRTFLASASAAAVWVWDLDSEECHALDGNTGTGEASLHAFTTSDNRTLLAAAGNDAVVRIWDPVTGELQQIPEAHPDGAYSVCAFTAADDRTMLATSGCENTIRIWDLVTGEQRGALQGHSGVPWGMCAFTAADKRVLLATAGDLEPVQMRDPATGEELPGLVDAVGGAWSVCAFPAEDGHSLLASGGNELQIWDPVTRRLQRALDGGGGRVYPVCSVTTSDGRTLLASAAASPGAGVRIWDPATGTLLRPVGDHTYNWDMCMFASSDGQLFLAAISDDDGLVKVWDPVTGQEKPALAGAADDVWSVCGFTADDGGAVLATAHGDSMIRIWDPATGVRQRILKGHATGVITVRAFTRGGRTFLASGGDDAEYRIWDPAIEQALLAIPVHSTPSVVADVDGILVVGLSAGLLAIELNPESLVRR